jgi:molybdate transport system substrate-binding protein
MRHRIKSLFPACLLAFAIGCSHASLPSSDASRPEITVAAAANLTEIFHEIGERFQARTGIHPVFSFGSTAQLTIQIENSAPFDVFASADAEHIEELSRKNLLVPGSQAVYATGVLALWVPTGSPAAVARLEDLISPAVKKIAVAKPELAPYGRAGVETLQSLGLWEKVQSKIVYAENINIAKQYGASNNAEAVFTAYSLVMRESGKVIVVDEKLHRPITQELAILASSSHVDAARKFVAFLLTGDGRTALENSGYRVP